MKDAGEDGQSSHGPFQRRPDIAPPGWFARWRGVSGEVGAETSITNFLADLEPSGVDPDLVAAIFARYRVPVERQDQIRHSIFQVAAEKAIKRGKLTEEGRRFLPTVAESLGVSQEKMALLVAAIVRRRKRIAAKRRRARLAEPEEQSAAVENEEEPQPADSPPPVACPKCGGVQISGNRRGYSMGKGVAGGLLLGPLGLVAGLTGSGTIKVTCLGCGHSWRPGR